MRVPAALALAALTACNDPKENDTDWAEPEETPDVALTTEVCGGQDEPQTVEIGDTEVPALCLDFTAAVDTTLEMLYLQDAAFMGTVDGRGGQLFDAEGNELSEREDMNPMGELRFEGTSAYFPADTTTQMWLLVDVGSTAGTYQARMENQDSMLTDPAGLQPGGTFPHLGSFITAE